MKKAAKLGLLYTANFKAYGVFAAHPTPANRRAFAAANRAYGKALARVIAR